MAQAKMKNIGIEVAHPPKEQCTDDHCPYHGHLTVHGRQFTGTIVSAKVPKLATVEWDRRVFVGKYERYTQKRTKLHVHNPPCINARLGDVVRVMECRPISKTKNFVILEVTGREELIADILEGRERASDKKKEPAPVEAKTAPAKKGKAAKSADEDN